MKRQALDLVPEPGTSSSRNADKAVNSKSKFLQDMSFLVRMIFFFPEGVPRLFREKEMVGVDMGDL